MKVIYEDEDIIVIKKPAGLATQSASITDKDCVSLLKDYIANNSNETKNETNGKYSNGKEPYIGVIHRLDQPVAGILVFAKNERAAADLSRQVQNDDMRKSYHALVEGKCPKIDNQEITDYMYKDSKASKAVIVKSNKSNNKNIKIQKATLVLTTENITSDTIAGDLTEDIITKTSLVRVELKTGRFHQIRAQLSNMGYPIAGDRKYGATVACPGCFAKGEGDKRGAIALVADSLEFKHPVTKQKLHFTFE